MSGRAGHWNPDCVAPGAEKHFKGSLFICMSHFRSWSALLFSRDAVRLCVPAFLTPGPPGPRCPGPGKWALGLSVEPDAPDSGELVQAPPGWAKKEEPAPGAEEKEPEGMSPARGSRTPVS